MDRQYIYYYWDGVKPARIYIGFGNQIIFDEVLEFNSFHYRGKVKSNSDKLVIKINDVNVTNKLVYPESGKWRLVIIANEIGCFIDNNIDNK